MRVSLPKLKVLERISPSRYTAIQKCPYRVVLANSLKQPLLPYPPNSHLGNIIHECIRLIFTDKIDTEKKFCEKWDELVNKEEDLLQEMEFDFFTPLHENVSGYAIKKLQVKALLHPEKEVKKWKGKIHYQTEKWLESKDRKIGGKVDLIRTHGSFIKLSDFKSGKILAEEGEIKEEYEDQLKLYAFLYNKEYGKYPDELTLIDLSKKEYPVSFSPDECKKIAGQAKKRLENINNLVREAEHRQLAKPNWETCKNCLYKPACAFYWEVEKPESEIIFTDVKGTVHSVKQFNNGNLSTKIHQGNKEITVSKLDSRYLDFLYAHKEKEVAFYNVRKSELPGKYQSIKTTKVYET